ncbi:hypothetical protein V1477_012540, partial [Vespula maculifrons]
YPFTSSNEINKTILCSTNVLRSLTLKYHSPEQYVESRVEIQGQAILTKNVHKSLLLPDSPGFVSSILRVNVSHFVWASKAHWYALRGGPACPYGLDGLIYLLRIANVLAMKL